MLTIRRVKDQFVARCGHGEFVLPIVEREDPESGAVLTEILTPSGIRSLARIAVGVEYDPMRAVEEDGTVSYSYTPRATVYRHVAPLLEKTAVDAFGGELLRISRVRDASTASRELAGVMSKVVSRLFKERWSWDGETSFEVYANSFQAVVLDGQIPRVRGKFLSEMETDRRLQAAKALIGQGLLSSPCATGTGCPGASFYLASKDGYTATELTNPLVHEMPAKRRGVVNAAKNLTEIAGAEPGYVQMQGTKRTPPMTNAIVVCMPSGADDSVIISQSLADQLTARIEQSNWYGIDGLINYRGGLRPAGRNGGLVKRAAEWPVGCDRRETPDGSVSCTRRTPKDVEPLRTANKDAQLLLALREQYEGKWSGMIARLGAYSAEEARAWREWLSKQPAWTHRNSSRPIRRRFPFGVEAVRLDGVLFFRENLGHSYRKPEVGMKLQADGDLLKGVVSRILPDSKMPLARLGGGFVRAQVICEMGKSTAKHGSLRFAHGQIALYALAKHVGGLGIIREPSVEETADMAVEAGVYEDDSLTCEVYDSTGGVSYGRFPAGVTRVGRHRQDPSVVSAVKGHGVDTTWKSCNTVASGGVVTGVADVLCLVAGGLKECAKELRSHIPTHTRRQLEALRGAIA